MHPTPRPHNYLPAPYAGHLFLDARKLVSAVMSSRTPTSSATRAADEESPLLGRTNGKNSASSQLRKHMAADVTKNWADLVLLFCYIITGLLDSSAVFIWGSFVSMQTGK
jgi:hypothetical protein